MVPLERNLHGHPLARLSWERQFEEALGTKYQSETACLFIENKDHFCQKMWMTSTWLEKKQKKAPMWKNWMKNVHLDEPTSFLDHVYLGCTQRECKPNAIIIDEYRAMSESRISAGATEQLPG